MRQARYAASQCISNTIISSQCFVFGICCTIMRANVYLHVHIVVWRGEERLCEVSIFAGVKDGRPRQAGLPYRHRLQ